MNYGELKLEILAYSHRDDVAPRLDFMLGLAANRIGRHLKSLENQDTVALAMASEAHAVLPNDFADIDYIRNTALDIRLAPVSWGRLMDYQVSGGAVEVFTIQGSGGQKLVAFGAQPGLVSDPGLELSYWQRPTPMVADTDENLVLTEWPQLYLYGGLVEVFAFTQDPDARTAALESFIGEAEDINTKVRTGTWGAGAGYGT